MHISYLPILRCPETGSLLSLENERREGDFIRSGWLVSAQGKRYPIRQFIPRFTNENYAKSFSVEWEKHPTIMLESFSNLSAYRKRFKEETRWPDRLEGELLLEAGCGPGSFTGIALETKARVVAVDLSRSVEIAHKNIGNTPNVLFIQGSILQLPFAQAAFDRVFCLGVIQHTPRPGDTFAELVRALKQGGRLAVDTYIVPEPQKGGGHILIDAKYKARRIVPRMSPRLLHWLITFYVHTVWLPARCIRKFFRNGMDINRRLLIDDYAYRLPGLTPDSYKEFAILDIFDFLSPVYDEPQTVASFRQFFETAGLEEIDVHPGYNGIEGRAVKPLEPR